MTPDVLRCRRRDLGSGRGLPDCARPSATTRRSPCSTRPTGSAACCAPRRSAASRWTSAPRRSSPAGPRCRRCCAELGLADRQITHHGRAARRSTARAGCIRCRPAPSTASRPRPRRWPDWSTTPTIAPDRAPSRTGRCAWRPGADPSVGEVVADRFGEQVVARSVDPMLAGVYAGSAATIGIRSAVPTVAAGAGRRGAPASPTPVRRRAAGQHRRAGVRRGRRRLPGAARRAGRPQRELHWVQAAVHDIGRRRQRAGRCATTRAPPGVPTR